MFKNLFGNGLKVSLKKSVGFTLVELLIVLVIMGVLGGGAMMAMGKSSDKSKFTTAESDLNNLQAAFTQYFQSVGDWHCVATSAAGAPFAGGTGSAVPTTAFAAGAANAGVPIYAAISNTATATSIAGTTCLSRKDRQILAGLLSKQDLTMLLDPWGNPYQIRSNFNPATGLGRIVIFSQYDTKQGTGASPAVAVLESTAADGWVIPASTVAVNKYGKKSPSTGAFPSLIRVIADNYQ